MKKKTQPKNTKKRTKAGENGFSYKLEALGIVYAALGLFMAVSLWYPEVGFLGDSAHYFLTMGLGRGALLLPIYLVILGLGYVVNHKRLQFSKRFFSILLFLVSLLSLWHASVIPEGAEILPESLPIGGGLLGGAINADRGDRIALDVVPSLRSVEHVIGGDLDQRDTGSRSGLREGRGRQGVDLPGL